MAKKIKVHLDFGQNEVQNAVIQNLSADPSTPVSGQVFYDTDDNRIKMHNGTAFKKLLTEDDSAANAVTRASNAGAANELMVSAGADRTAQTFSGTGIIKVTSGVASVATAGTDYVTASSTNTLTNKTIDANGTGNSITNLETADFATNVIDTDVTLAANSDTRLATQKATKAYVDAILSASDAFVFQGVIDASTNPNYPAADAGDVYKISVAGKIGGASGPNVEVGDSIYCITDSSASGDQATVGANWVILQVNIDGAVTGPTSSTDNALARFDSTTGKLIQNSNATLSDAGTMNLAAGQTYQVNGTNILTGFTKKFAATFNDTTDWAGAGPFTITVTNGTHALGATANLTAQVRELSGSDYNLVDVELQFQTDGDVVITSNAKFEGSYVLIG